MENNNCINVYQISNDAISMLEDKISLLHLEKIGREVHLRSTGVLNHYDVYMDDNYQIYTRQIEVMRSCIVLLETQMRL